MNGSGHRYSYGPVPSRRLGTSLGINNIPAKTCSYACVYCQAGHTDRMQVERSQFFDPPAVFQDVQSRLKRAAEMGLHVDFLTFVPDGEPTLDSRLGTMIQLVRSLGVPVGIITNGSLLWRDDVRAELMPADFVSVKVDAVRESTWKRINRPHGNLRLTSVLQGILDFAGSFRGTLTSETMLVVGINDTIEELEAIGDFLHRVRPSKAYLSLPTRPPAEGKLATPDEEQINRAYQVLAAGISPLEHLIGYEGNAFASTGIIEKDILDITAVHPMRKEAILSLLERASAPASTLDRLVEQGDLAATLYQGHTYYVRRLRPGRGGAR